MHQLTNFTKPEIQQRYYSETKKVAELAVDKIVIEDNRISILISKQKLRDVLAGAKSDNNSNDETIEISVFVKFKSYAGRKIAYSANGNAISFNKTNHDQTLIRAITRSYKWNKMLESDAAKSITEIARKENVERTYASDILRLKYLAPLITTMILNGTQPRTLNLSSLTDQKLPMCWNQQKQLLNIA